MNRFAGVLAAALIALVGCGGGSSDSGGPSVAVAGRDGALKTAAVDRAGRRAFDGAPPVIPHEPMGVQCTSCHNERGMDVQGLGYAPPSPHERTGGLSATSNWRQCHVFRQTDAVFVASTFDGLPQDLRPGSRAHEGAPPVMPHRTLMHENCSACHDGPAAREEIRTSHPERQNCVQCHVERRATDAFVR